MGFTLLTICVLLCTFGPAMVSAYDVFLSISYSNSTFPGLKGSTATLTCTGVLEEEWERHYELNFYKENTTNLMWYYRIGNTNLIYYNYWDDNRMSHLLVDSSSTGVTFSITNLDCTDETKYICLAYHVPQGTPFGYYLAREQILSLMVEPMQPTFVAFPSLSNDVNEVLEHTDLTVYCSAVTGSPTKGSLHWRIYRDGVPEDIDDPWSDSRVVMTNGVTNCEETYESTLTLNMCCTYQKVAVACFVINEDFRPRSDLPSSCMEESVLYNQTRELLVLLPAEDSGNSSTIAIAVGVASLVIIVVLVVAVVYLYKANKKLKDTAQGSPGTFGQNTAMEQAENAAARYVVHSLPPQPDNASALPA